MPIHARATAIRFAALSSPRRSRGPADGTPEVCWAICTRPADWTRASDLPVWGHLQDFRKAAASPALSRSGNEFCELSRNGLFGDYYRVVSLRREAILQTLHQLISDLLRGDARQKFWYRSPPNLGHPWDLGVRSRLSQDVLLRSQAFQRIDAGGGPCRHDGVMSYTVGQRAREIAVRMTLGARRSEVSRMIVGQAAVYVAVGVITGLAGAFAGTRLMTGLLFGVAATDPATLLSAAAVVIVTSLAASSIPAIRAARSTPVAVLRPE